MMRRNKFIVSRRLLNTKIREDYNLLRVERKERLFIIEGDLY